MERKYLSGNIRERLQDLMKERKITQSELAAKIGMDVSTLSRFISNATGKLGDENIKKIAKEFEVSTDFLLGVTDIPDRMNYDIAELGLSVQAAKNLYTGKVNAEVVNRLLENKNFAAMTNMIAHYFDDITPEMVAEAITGSVSGMEGVDPEALKQFNQALIGLLTVKPTEDEHDGS